MQTVIKAIIILILVGFVFGCSSGSARDAEESRLIEQLTFWQQRQIEEMGAGNSMQLSRTYSVDDSLLPFITREALYYYNLDEYENVESDDYWKTADETAIEQSGDKEDMAILIYVLFREEMLVPDDSLWVRMYKFSSGLFNSEWMAATVVQGFNGAVYVILQDATVVEKDYLAQANSGRLIKTLDFNLFEYKFQYNY